jgi:hypothetical protein
MLRAQDVEKQCRGVRVRERHPSSAWRMARVRQEPRRRHRLGTGFGDRFGISEGSSGLPEAGVRQTNEVIK